MNRYEKGKIYKITDVGYNKCYIGSTVETLSRRISRHRTGYRRLLEGKKEGNNTSYSLFEEFGMENCKIELIENYPCSWRHVDIYPCVFSRFYAFRVCVCGVGWGGGINVP